MSHIDGPFCFALISKKRGILSAINADTPLDQKAGVVARLVF